MTEDVFSNLLLASGLESLDFTDAGKEKCIYQSLLISGNLQLRQLKEPKREKNNHKEKGKTADTSLFPFEGSFL